MARNLEYGAGGLVGVLTPQANATAEIEMSVLAGPDLGLITGRLTCQHPDLKRRLAVYFEEIESAIAQFADAPLEAIAVACTGATYVLDRPVPAFDAPWDGPCPVISSVAAIDAALRALGARRIAMVSPYPDWLTSLCTAYWTRLGYEIAILRQATPVPSGYHPIYAQRSQAALDVLADHATLPVDAVVVSGTGLPSLRAIASLNAGPGPKVISSNLCLSWAIDEILRGRGADPGSPLPWLSADAPWVARMKARYPLAAAGAAFCQSGTSGRAK
jgi:maleate cis-trans isomerase